MPKQILLVEDSVTMQKVVQITFAREDYQIVSATSADEALARLKESRPDIVLADAGLPGKSGYDLSAAIKGEAATRDVPVLLLTGNFNPYDETRAKSAGVDSHIVKPFDTGSLIEKVNELVKRRAGVSTPAATATAPAAQAPAAAPVRTPAPVAAAPAAAAPARTPTAPPPSAATPSGLVLGSGKPMAPAAATPLVPPSNADLNRSTLMGIQTVNPLGTPSLRPPMPAATPAVTAKPAAASSAGRSESPTSSEGVRMPEPIRAASAAGSSAGGISSQVPQMPRPSLIPRAPVPAPVLAALERIAARGAEYEAIAKLSAEAIQQIVWEVVPELAEVIIRSELDRLVKERKA